VPPEAEATILCRGAEALGLALTDGQIEALLRFGALLTRWNQVFNLTAIGAGERLLTHHLLDSLALVRPLQELLHRTHLERPRVLDVGSGGGLPAVPLAIACPQIDITLVDAVQKKTAFLTQAAVELGLAHVAIRHARVETMEGHYDIITSRAFAALADLVKWTDHLLAPAGCWLAMKGRIDPTELAALPATVRIAAIQPLMVPGLDEARHLVKIRRA
jgi:16S rRNA (guanine527-N7)-methyltransferase